MGFTLKDMGNEPFCMRAGFSSPPDESGGCPVKISLMGFRHVLQQCGKAAFLITSGMAGHPSILEQDLHCSGSQAHIYLLFYQLIGYAIVMVIELDMVVDIDPGLFPLCIFIPTIRQGSKSGFI
jgi:hypothetical protein